MFQIFAEANRTKDYTISIKSPDEDYVTLESSDVVRVKIGRVGTVALDLSETATANGSVVTQTENGDGSATHAQVTLRLAQADTIDLKGIYSIEVNVVDDSDSDLIKAVDYGCVIFLGSLGGSIGL